MDIGSNVAPPSHTCEGFAITCNMLVVNLALALTLAPLASVALLHSRAQRRITDTANCLTVTVPHQRTRVPLAVLAHSDRISPFTLHGVVCGERAHSRK